MNSCFRTLQFAGDPLGHFLLFLLKPLALNREKRSVRDILPGFPGPFPETERMVHLKERDVVRRDLGTAERGDVQPFENPFRLGRTMIREKRATVIDRGGGASREAAVQLQGELDRLFRPNAIQEKRGGIAIERQGIVRNDAITVFGGFQKDSAVLQSIGGEKDLVPIIQIFFQLWFELLQKAQSEFRI